jgi:hypothetical protein
MRSRDPRLILPATSSIPLAADPSLGAGGRVRSATAPGQRTIVEASVIFRGVVGIKFFLTAAKHPADEIGLPLDIVLSDVRTLHRNDCQSCRYHSGVPGEAGPAGNSASIDRENPALGCTRGGDAGHAPCATLETPPGLRGVARTFPT